MVRACMRACVRRLVCLECQQAWKPNSIRRHSILGWKRGGTHPSAGLLFHDAGGTGGGGRGGTRLAGGGVEWRYLRNKEMVHRTSNNNVPPSPPPPRDRYKGSIVYPHCPIDKSSGKEIGRFSYTLPLPERGKRQEEEEDNVSRSKR